MSNLEPTAQSRLKQLVSTYGPGFAPAFLGTAFVLVWIQCILYARYIWVDSGLTTVAINFARCVCIVALGAAALRRPFSPAVEKGLGWASCGLMTVGGLLFFVQSSYPSLPFTPAAAAFCGIGLAWGGGMWINFYRRLELREALLVTFSSLGLSAVFGIFVGYAQEDIAFFVSMLVPMVSLAMYRSAQKALDSLESQGGPGAMPDDAYAGEPRSTILRFMAGIALFSFVLGASRGFPGGESIKLEPLFQLIQHLSVVALSAAIVWRTLALGKSLKFSTLWQLQLASLAVGVILLSTLDPTLGQVGATLIAVTNLFQVGFLWFVSYDVSRHRASVPPYLILGCFWFAHLFFREAGRLLMWFMGENGGFEQRIIIAVLICLLAVSVGFLLADSIPSSRPLFAEVLENDPGRAARGSLFSRRPRTEGRQAAFPAAEKAASPTASSDGAPAESQDPEHLDAAARLAGLRASKAQERFGLTNRETEVLALLAEGRSASYIAEELVLSDNTVRGYVKNVYQKMDVHSKQDLIDYMKTL